LVLLASYLLLARMLRIAEVSELIGMVRSRSTG
jgi:hypothetical protein